MVLETMKYKWYKNKQIICINLNALTRDIYVYEKCKSTPASHSHRVHVRVVFKPIFLDLNAYILRIS